MPTGSPRWRDRIGTHGRRIGIAWQGNPAAAAERGRSIPLREFLPLAQVPGVRLISLQKHHGLEQLASCRRDCASRPWATISMPAPTHSSTLPR